MESTEGGQRSNGVPNSSSSTYSPTASNPISPTSYPSTSGLFPENQANIPEAQVAAEQPKFFFNEKYAKLGVKGNFMPLAAQPVNVDLADWLAHQSKPIGSHVSGVY